MNFIFAFLAVALVLLSFAISATRFRQVLSAPSMVCLWLLGWLAVANINLLGFPKVSLDANLLVILSMLAFIVGIGFGPKNTHRTNVSQESKSETRGTILIVSGLCLLLPIYFILIPRLIATQDFVNMFSGGAAKAYESDIRADNFGSENRYYYFYTLAFTINIVAYYIGTALFAKRFNLRVLLIALSPSILYAIATNGRTNIYYAGLLLVGMIVALPSQMRKQVILTYWKRLFIMGGAVAVLAILVLVATKRENVGKSLVNIPQQYLYYHHLGFNLVGLEVDGNLMLPEEPAWGKSSAVSLEQMAHIFVKRVFGEMRFLYWFKSSEVFQPFRHLGEGYYANAYYTTFYQLWKDGGLLFSCFGFFIYGVFFARVYSNFLVNLTFRSALMVAFLTDFGLQSLFMSPLNRFQFGFIVIGLFAVYYIPIEKIIPPGIWQASSRILFGRNQSNLGRELRKQTK